MSSQPQPTSPHKKQRALHLGCAATLALTRMAVELKFLIQWVPMLGTVQTPADGGGGGQDWIISADAELCILAAPVRCALRAWQSNCVLIQGCQCLALETPADGGGGGQDWIRTSEGVSQRIYSPPRLATSVPTRLSHDKPR